MSDVQIAVIDQQDTQIVLAVPGVQGATGSSIPSGGTIDQVLRKNSSTDYDAGWTQVTSAMIANGAIVNEDINNGAGIAGTKISPDFGGQAVTTTGQVSAARVNVTNNTPPSNGIYLPSANNVAISTGGSGRLFVDASGRVGVGTASPTSLLHLSASALADLRFTDTGEATDQKNWVWQTGTGIGAGTFRLRVINDANSTGENAYIVTRSGASAQTHQWLTAGSERLRITSAGLVGVGTSSPGAVLHSVGTNSGLPVTSGTTQTYCSLRLGGSNSTGIVDFGISGSANWIQSTDRTDLSQKYSLLLNPNGGNVGIGTTSPSGIFEACGSSSYFRPAGAAGTFFQITAGAANGDVTLSASANSGNYPPLVFSTGGGEKVRIDSSGRLLVGTSSAPTAGDSQYGLIRIQGNTSSASGFGAFSIGRGQASASIVANSELGHIYFTANDGSPYASVSAYSDAAGGTNDYPGRLVFSVTRDGQASPTERMRIGNNGIAYCFAQLSVLVASSATGSGTSEYVFVGQHSATAIGNGTDCIRIYTNGNVVNLNNSYGAISDLKLKENIVDADSQWSDIKALQVRKYNFKEGQTHTQIGLVAQEVELVSPGLVTESPDRDAEGNNLGTVTKSVNYSVLYMKAVKALQEAMERIEVLEQRLTDAGIA